MTRQLSASCNLVGPTTSHIAPYRSHVSSVLSRTHALLISESWKPSPASHAILRDREEVPLDRDLPSRLYTWPPFTSSMTKKLSVPSCASRWKLQGMRSRKRSTAIRGL